MLNPLITLTTDFGSSDHFVGTMKGVISGIAPKARLVDITHEIAPYEIAEAAFTVAQAYRYFPKRTIHVIVVDPGVGSSRRPILAEMAGQYFVAPDNGVLSLIASRETAKVRHVTADRYFLHPVSRTFHGRDIFAPVAAHLAAGIVPAKFGKRIDDYVCLAAGTPVRVSKSQWTGTVLKVDHFGNLITNFHVDDFPRLTSSPFELKAGVQAVSRLALNFSECEPEELFVVVGSSGYLEVAVNQGSAAATLGCGAGAPVELSVF